MNKNKIEMAVLEIIKDEDYNDAPRKLTVITPSVAFDYFQIQIEQDNQDAYINLDESELSIFRNQLNEIDLPTERKEPQDKVDLLKEKIRQIKNLAEYTKSLTKTEAFRFLEANTSCVNDLKKQLYNSDPTIVFFSEIAEDFQSRYERELDRMEQKLADNG